MSKPKKRKTEVTDLRTMLLKCIIGAFVGTAIFFALLSLFALICTKKDISESMYTAVVLVLGGMSALICGYTAVKPIRRRGLAFGAVSALPMYICIVSVSVLCNNAGLTAYGWLMMLVCVALSAFGGVIASNRK